MRLLGVQTPRLRTVPPYERTYGPDVRDLAGLAGLDLDPWQGAALDDFCALSPADPGRWNTLENVLIVGRQNGKSAALEAYLLGCLYLFDDPLTTYSAHRFDASQEMFRRVIGLIRNTPSLLRRVRKVSEAHGKEGIELKGGQRLLFKARSDKANRAFSGDKAVIDEAFKLDADTMGAIMPTLSARPNPQIVYASSQGWEISEHLGKLRHRALTAICQRLRAEGLDVDGIAALLGLEAPRVARYLQRPAGAGTGLAFLEWSVPDSTPRTRGAMDDPELWAQANPALGRRITGQFVGAELRTMGAVQFGRERLGIGADLPPDEEDEGGWEVISEADWSKLAVQGEAPRPGTEGPRRPVFAIDMKPDGSKAAITAVFRDEHGALIVEVINHAQGAAWVVPRAKELKGRYKVVAFAVDKRGPAGYLIKALRDADLPVHVMDTGQIADAYGQFMDAATDTRDLVHLDDEPLNEAVKGATTRPLGDRKTWDRKGDADICPLVAATNGVGAHLELASTDDDPLNNIW
ncbi:hypothetical protein [Actinomadura sp. NPDC049753]|uniref:hypothetical protein n=1 Tax=Actinomadura sp. NPDC049753 TaxID=3154739 RepID=UPI003434502A